MRQGGSLKIKQARTEFAGLNKAGWWDWFRQPVNTDRSHQVGHNVGGHAVSRDLSPLDCDVWP
jgi:hypothetical protein